MDVDPESASGSISAAHAGASTMGSEDTGSKAGSGGKRRKSDSGAGNLHAETGPASLGQRDLRTRLVHGLLTAYLDASGRQNAEQRQACVYEMLHILCQPFLWQRWAPAWAFCVKQVEVRMAGCLTDHAQVVLRPSCTSSHAGSSCFSWISLLKLAVLALGCPTRSQTHQLGMMYILLPQAATQQAESCAHQRSLSQNTIKPIPSNECESQV